MMNRFATLLSLLLLLLAGNARAVIGDITGVEIDAQGWYARVWVSGFHTQAMFFNGFLTNNAPSWTNGLRLDITSMGFDDTGTFTTRRRSVYGTKVLRFVTPNQAINKIVADGTNSIFAVALSEPVFDLDSNIVAQVRSGAFAMTNVATNCNAGVDLEVTNNSSQPYPKVIANWSYPGWQNETNSTIRLRMVGFNWSARLGRPLVAVKLIGTDESGDAVTNTVTTMSIDYTMPDAQRFGEYIADLSQSSWLQHDRIRCDFIAYPWIGDSTSVMDTTLNTYNGDARPTSITNYCDKTNTTKWIAVIGTAGAAPRVTNVHPSSVNSAHYFGSFAAGNDQLAATNGLVNGHNTSGTGIMYVRDTITAFSGATVASNIVPKSWTVIRPFPGHAVSLSTDTGTDDLSDRVKIEGQFEGGTIRLAFATTTIPFSSMQKLWLDRCFIDSSGNGPFQATEMWVTHCAVSNFTQGFRASSISANEWFNLRGNDLNGFNTTLLVQTCLGNRKTATNGWDYRVVYDISGQGASHDFQIAYNNFWGSMAVGGGSEAFSVMNAAFVVTQGVAAVQNVIERIGAAGSPAAQFASANQIASTNLLLWHNPVLGERIADYGSSGSESVLVNRFNWSDKGNIYDLTGFKKDWNTTTDADRTNNWGLMWGTGRSGTMFVECRVNAAAGTFPPDFDGVNCHHPPGSGTNIINFPAFTDRKAYDGGGAVTAGGGNYRMLSHSPGFQQTVDWALPFDLEGHTRSAIDPPGAYVSGNVRKGGFF